MPHTERWTKQERSAFDPLRESVGFYRRCLVLSINAVDSSVDVIVAQERGGPGTGHELRLVSMEAPIVPLSIDDCEKLIARLQKAVADRRAYLNLNPNGLAK